MPHLVKVPATTWNFAAMFALFVFVLIELNAMVVAHPGRFALRKIPADVSSKIMGRPGQNAVVIVESGAKSVTFECTGYGVVIDVDKHATVESPCLDSISSSTLNATSVRYHSVSTTRCGLLSNASKAQVLCAVWGQDWVTDSYEKTTNTVPRNRSNVTAVRVDETVPKLFLVSVWLLGVGVFAHAAGARTRYRAHTGYLHYLLMSAGTAVAFAGVVLSRGADSRFFDRKPHEVVGLSVLAGLFINMLLGAATYTLRVSGQAQRGAMVGRAHRVVGVTVLACAAYLHYSGTEKNGPLQMYEGDYKDAEISFYAWTAFVALAIALGGYVYIGGLPSKQPQTTYRMLETRWDGKAPNLMAL